MADKVKYYRLDKIDAIHDLRYALLIGQRANGKSYAVKERALINAWVHKQLFIYLRRYSLDIKMNAVTSYFDDAPVKTITGGEWERVVAYQGYLYWARFNEDTMKDERSKDPIGRYCALNEDARYKSQVFKDYHTIIFEEMIPNDNMYLENEPTRLQHFVSTVFRHNTGICYVIGNTLSRVCPYCKEWCIDFTRMKQGDVQVYNFHVGNDTIKVAVEYCATTNYKNTMFFGKAAKNILSGEWEVDDRPKLPKSLKEFEELYKMLIEYQNFKFILLLLCDPDNGGKICYIYPSTHDFTGFRILTDRFSTDPFINARLDLSKKPENDIAQCFALNKLCFSDNLTGSDFSAVNEHFNIACMRSFE